MSVIPFSATREQPWKNGGGTTREITRWPDRDDYDVRVSLAEVTRSGPFSQFPGYRRWTFLAGPAPIELVSDQVRTKLVALGDHLEQPGEVPLAATLPAGPTVLLNVLGRTAIVVGHGPTAHPVRLAFALVDTAQLPRWSTVVLDVPGVFDTTACVWVADR